MSESAHLQPYNRDNKETAEKKPIHQLMKYQKSKNEFITDN